MGEQAEQIKAQAVLLSKAKKQIEELQRRITDLQEASAPADDLLQLASKMLSEGALREGGVQQGQRCTERVLAAAAV